MILRRKTSNTAPEPGLRDRYPGFFRIARDLKPMIINFAVKKKKLDEYGAPTGVNDEVVIKDWATLEEANLITSVTAMGTHRVVLDIDHDAMLIPSTTPGHHHLIIDVPVDWNHYQTVLRALANAGIIEPGYAKASIAKGYTGIRTPWTRKESTEEAA